MNSDLLDSANIWISNLIVQSIVENVYSITFEDDLLDWNPDHVKYLPVWTMSQSAPPEKLVSRMMIRFDQMDIKEVKDDALFSAGLLTADELLESLQQTPARKMSAKSIQLPIFRD